jgi:hypothetical protein
MKMGLGHSPSAVTSGLVLALDAGNTKSYPNTGTVWTDLSGNGNTGTLTNGPTFNSYDARTNGNLYSEQFNNAVYSINQGTISTNQAVSPDGTTTAENLTASAGTVNPYAYQAVTTVTNSVYTFSVYVKKNTHDFVQIVLNGVSNGFANFNISSGVVGTLGSGGSATSSIVNAGNGWYRCIITYTTATTGNNGYINLIGSATSGRSATFSAAGTESVYLWGQQLELGSFATSYIPTTSSAVTRSAGPATLVFDGVNDYVTCGISSSINAASTSLTWSCWFKSNSISTEQLLFSNVNATATNGFQIEIFQSKMLMAVYPAGTYAFANTTLSSNTWYNLCATYSSGAITYYLNGVNDGTTSRTFTASTGPTYISSWAYSAGYFINGSASSVLFYNTALTADQVLQNFNALRGRFGL